MNNPSIVYVRLMGDEEGKGRQGKRGEKIGEKFQDRQHKKREALEMAKSSSDALPESFQKILSPTATIFEGVSPETVHKVLSFFSTVSVSAVLPDHSTTKDFYSELIAGLLKPLRIEPGRVTCLLTVKPPIINTFSTVHGGAVAAIAEVMSIACARTVVAEGKEVFLGEQSISYLSAVQNNVSL
ncbi:hypothetical protein L484_022253 [Morus notabilis]|uniref:Thioesterase domain-containing protein n=1 Tax=Morus notabilis TaxID=981085 RepID=W9S628_9ROSA|nr:hypothetical protein L484_022253 [Morus notabilis]